MSAQDKIAQILIHLNINAKTFSEKLGYERPQIIYDIQKGKTKRISDDLAFKIASVFPEINKSWLLADEGEMLKQTDIKGNNNIVQTGIVHGNNTQGNNITLTESDKERLLNLLEINSKSLLNKDEQIDKFQKQIDRLLTLLEKRL